MQVTNDNQNNEQSKKINFQTFGNICLLIIIILIIGNGFLIYYLMNNGEETLEIEETVEEQNEQEVDTVANLINTVVANNVNSTTINSTDANTRKVMNEDLIVLYDGLILDTSKMDNVELKYIDNTSNDKDKYVITYYNYEHFKMVDSTLGQLSDQVYENSVQIENVGKIAISENYNAITGEITVINSIPTIISDNNNLSEYDSVKTIVADLDANGTNEYIVILANKNTGYSKISLYDSNGSLVNDLAYIQKNMWGQTSDKEYYLSLENVNILDIDNDGIMEILVEIPKYEGEPSVSIVKYKNGEYTGKSNIECSLLP